MKTLTHFFTTHKALKTWFFTCLIGGALMSIMHRSESHSAQNFFSMVIVAAALAYFPPSWSKLSWRGLLTWVGLFYAPTLVLIIAIIHWGHIPFLGPAPVVFANALGLLLLAVWRERMTRMQSHADTVSVRREATAPAVENVAEGQPIALQTSLPMAVDTAMAAQDVRIRR